LVRFLYTFSALLKISWKLDDDSAVRRELDIRPKSRCEESVLRGQWRMLRRELGRGEQFDVHKVHRALPRVHACEYSQEHVRLLVRPGADGDDRRAKHLMTKESDGHDVYGKRNYCKIKMPNVMAWRMLFSRMSLGDRRPQ
jgi:hypothetical protein